MERFALFLRHCGHAIGTRRFSKFCLRIVEKYGLDGIDVDWECPVTDGKKTDHKQWVMVGSAGLEPATSCL
jgi:GH18 family chitinase